MRGIIVIFVLANVGLASSNEQASMDDLADQVADKLIDKFLGRAMSMPIDDADLDGTTLGKAAPGSTIEKPAAVNLIALQPTARTVVNRGASPLMSVPHIASRPASYRPQVQANALRGSYWQPMPTAFSSSMTMSQPLKTGFMTTPVHAIQDTLRMHGVPPHPLERLTLTAAAATRDPSMKAQMFQEFAALDTGLQNRVKKLGREVAVRAESLKKEEMAGVTAPLGFWDPLGLTTNADDSTLYLYREIELRHGRVAMIASLGIIVAEKFHPFFGDETWVSAAASHHSPLQVEKFWPAALTAIAIVEFAFAQDPNKAPGDLGYDPMGMKPKDEKGLKEMQTKELNNGRLAMLATTGMLVQELIYEKSIF